MRSGEPREGPAAVVVRLMKRKPGFGIEPDNSSGALAGFRLEGNAGEIQVSLKTQRIS
jgi:hypothetical protein